MTFTLGLTIVLGIFGLFGHLSWVALSMLMLWGVLGYATAPGLQLRLMDHAQGAPTIGSSMNIAALNIGNAMGAWVCGIPLGTAGEHAQDALFIGSGLALAATLTLLVSHAIQQHAMQSQRQ